MRFFALPILTLALSVLIAAPLSAQEKQAHWNKRCNKSQTETEHCEIFQRLMVKETKNRYAEIAIARHPIEDGYQALIHLPLGISIPNGILVYVDDQEVAQEELQFCIIDGCIAGLNLVDNDILSHMKAGKVLSFVFVSPTQETLSADFSLTGFNTSFASL